jgi:hypothetical protein
MDEGRRCEDKPEPAPITYPAEGYASIMMRVADRREDVMRLVRLGEEPTKIGADVRAALAAWGVGDEVLGGVAVLGWTPPDSSRALDAVIVLSRGVIVVVGVDLPQPALTLEAPMQTPWTVDGWPLVRTEGAVNPALDAVESASALAAHLQAHDIEPLPVSTIVAVGPFVGQVTQPTNDLHRGVRVLHPSTTSILAAVRELATYPHPCAVNPARRLLEVLDEDTAKLDDDELTAEGFSDTVTSDPASADTWQIPKVEDESAPPAPRTPASPVAAPRTPTPVRRPKLIALSAIPLLLCFAIVLLIQTGGTATSPPPPPAPESTVDGVGFVRRASQQDTNCAQHSFGDIQAWFQQQPCAGLTRFTFSTEVTRRPAAVAVAVVDLSDEDSVAKFRDLLDTAGNGGLTDPVADAHRWAGGPRSFDGAARVIEQTGNRVRIVQAVWVNGGSQPDDVELRALAERGTRLPETSA